MHPLVRTAATGTAFAAAGGGALLGYALWEAGDYQLRRVSVQALSPGTRSLTLLHLSDLHLTAYQHKKADWVTSLAETAPDLVVVTGDFISNRAAFDPLIDCLGPLLEIPGAFVFGSNDYYDAKLKNPLKYFMGPSHVGQRVPNLPTEELRARLSEPGWLDLNNRTGSLSVAGVELSLLGVDDPHIKRDRFDLVKGGFAEEADVRIGVTHAPYRRVLDAFVGEGADLMLAGHTHGGQICLPGVGALVTNCDIDRRRVRGLSQYSGVPLHVSAGVGTNPFTPIRLACKPEATLLTLEPRTA